MARKGSKAGARNAQLDRAAKGDSDIDVGPVEDGSPQTRDASGHEGWWAALAFLVCTLMLAYPALDHRFLINLQSDQYIAGYAFRDFAARSLRAGQGFPQWNAFLFGGMPYIAAMHGDIFYPTFLLRLFLPTDVAMTWGFIVHIYLSGLFTYLFLRAWGVAFFPSLFGGVAYMLTGVVASYVSPGHDGKLFVSALLPAALWQLVRGIREGRTTAWGALAITVGLAVLSPHPQLLQYFLITCGAFALFVALAGRSRNTVHWTITLRRLGFTLGAVLLGGLIGAVQYLPVREYVAWSHRASGLSYQGATRYSFPIEELANLYLPQFSGILDKYWGRNLIHLHSEYLGVVALFLAPLSFRFSPRKTFALFWAAVLIVTLVWALGGNTPFFRLIYEVMPGTKFFRAPSTIYYVSSFALSVLSALGLERVMNQGVRVSYPMGWLLASGVVALCVTLGIITSIVSHVAMSAASAIVEQLGIDPSNAGQIASQLVDKVRSNHADVVLGAWRSFFFVAVTAGVVIAFQRNRVRATWLAAVLVGTAAVDQWSVDRLYWKFMQPADQLFASDAIIEYLKRQPQPGRVLAVARSDANVTPRDPYFGTDKMGRGTGFMVHGIRAVTGYHSNELARYQLIGGEVGTGRYQNILSPMFWRHENVRWLYTNAEVEDSTLHLVKGPVMNSAGSSAYLYELPGRNPYAWVSSSWVALTDSAALALVTDARFNPDRLSILADSGSGIRKKSGQSERANPPTAAVSSFGAGYASIRLETPAPVGSTLVVAENYYPGWRAKVDGHERPVERADFNLLGVALPAGTRKIELRYSDPAYGTGKIITVAAIGMSLVLVLAGLRSQAARAR